MLKQELGKRLLDMRKHRKKSQADVAGYLGLTIAAYQNYENGRREAGYDVLVKLADFYGVTTDYLLGREQIEDPIVQLTKRTDVSFDELEEQYAKMPEEIQAIVISLMKALHKLDKERALQERVRSMTIKLHRNKAAAGSGFELSDEDEWEVIEIEETPEAWDADFAVEVDGESMLPDFKDGDTVLVKLDPDVPIGSVGLFTNDGKGYIKERGEDRLISRNHEYPDIFGESICIGLVLGIAKRL